MDLRSELKYAAGVDEVFAMLCDETFRKQVCEATHARSYEVSVTPAGTGTEVRLSRKLDAPDLARKFIGDTLEIVQVESWGAPAADGTRTADLRVDVPGKPASMRGAITLAATPAGSTESVRGEITVKVPIIGRTLEGEIRRGLLEAIAEEGRIGTRWLAG